MGSRSTINTSREEKPFAKDAAAHGGYLYTTQSPYSAGVALDRQTKEVLKLADFKGKRILDIGCGDGAITIDLFDRTQPLSIEGLEPAAPAIDIARRRVNGRAVNFSVGSAYEIPHADLSFDVAHLRGVLHHMDLPERAVAEAARVARHVIILEPNGLNPVLKFIEKVSPYHRSHGERSFFPGTIRKWMRDAGLEVVADSYCCLVPYFCPELAARALKRVEPAVEHTPFLRQIVSGAYVVAGKHKKCS